MRDESALYLPAWTWRRGVAVLRQRINNLAATDELALATFGIVRMDMESWDGVVVPWGDVARASGPSGCDEPVTAAARACD